MKILFPVLILLGIGIVMVYSASYAVALEKFGSGQFFLKKQIVFALIGILCMIICKNIPLNIFRDSSYPLLFCSIIFLILVRFTGLGISAGGATRWLRLGAFSFQPSEFARFAMIVYLSYSLSKKGEKLKEFSIGFLPHILIFGTFSLLILMQPDFGAALILGMLTWIMMFVAGVRFAHLSSSLILLVPAGYFFLVSADYRMQRMTVFLNPWEHSGNGGYQIIHSLMAFGSGGIFGTGVGMSFQKLFYLPEPHTDFIFSVIGEELGLLGVLLIISLFGIIIYKGIRISMQTDDKFASYLAMGLTTALALQVCINMGVTLALLPTKGLTLPFISYGGTSLIMNMTSIGILMNIQTSEQHE